jgi:hypothetical protein
MTGANAIAAPKHGDGAAPASPAGDIRPGAEPALQCLDAGEEPCG